MKEREIILQSKLLSSFSDVTHAMSTKLGGCENPPFYNNMSYWVGDNKETIKLNRDRYFGSLGIDQNKLVIPQQVHSANVRIINEPGYYHDYDGLITSIKDVFLIISTADCYPVFIYDKVKRIVSAIHSGWRGTQKKILTNAIMIMKNELNSESENMIVFVGPGISKDKFEVGKEVADLFPGKYVFPNNGKYFIDLKSNILEQLLSQDLKKENIEMSDLCTYCEEGYLHSYRRDREKSGRMFSVIGMKSK